MTAARETLPNSDVQYYHWVGNTLFVNDWKVGSISLCGHMWDIHKWEGGDWHLVRTTTSKRDARRYCEIFNGIPQSLLMQDNRVWAYDIEPWLNETALRMERNNEDISVGGHLHGDDQSGILAAV